MYEKVGLERRRRRKARRRTKEEEKIKRVEIDYWVNNLKVQKVEDISRLRIMERCGQFFF